MNSLRFILWCEAAGALLAAIGILGWIGKGF